MIKESWAIWGPKIAEAGYCVFSVTHGLHHKGNQAFGGLNSIPENAKEVGSFIDNILNATNTKQVDVVGHSQGGVLARYWSRYQGGAGKISRMIGISPVTHGATLSGIETLARAIGLREFSRASLDLAAPALMQMVTDSEFMKKLNDKGDTLPGVFQANIVTKFDEIVTPYTSGFQTGPGVVNEELQNLCSFDYSEHLMITNSLVALRWTLNQLDPSTAKPADCFPVFIPGGR
ncbi:hypothetical protein BGZ92_011201 [Podila epicladia]|nr:hypothetical protein BGZ92_011201 [Podila epicladia]